MGTKERRNGRAALGEAAGRAGLGRAPAAGCRRMAPLRVLELYSGIGGMHQALKGTGERPRQRVPPCSLPPQPRCAPRPPPRPPPPPRAPSSPWGGLRWPLFSHSPFPSGAWRLPPPSCTSTVWEEAVGREAGLVPSPQARRHSFPLCRGGKVTLWRWGWGCLTGLSSGAAWVRVVRGIGHWVLASDLFALGIYGCKLSSAQKHLWPAGWHQVPRSTLGWKLGIHAPSSAQAAAPGKAVILCSLIHSLSSTDPPLLQTG